MKLFVFLFLLFPLLSSAEKFNFVYTEHCQKGLAYYKDNEPEKAGFEFLKALEIDKEDKTSKQMLAALEREIFREEPEDPYKDVVKELYFKGLVYFRAGEKEKACAEWKKGLALNPSNKQLLEFNELVSFTQPDKSPEKSGNFEKEQKTTAKKNGKAAEQKEKNKIFAPKKSVDEKKVSDLYYEGLKLYKQGDLKKAIAIWEQVLVFDPDLSKARKNLERAKKELKQGD